MRTILLLLLALVAGCASRPPALSSLDGQHYWQAEGRLALKSGQGGGNLNFIWAQLGASYRLALSGPLGVGNTELMVTPGQVSLRHPERGLLQADSPEALLAESTGQQAPVSLLAHWIRAEAASDGARIERDANGRVLLIEEAGWTARYPEWQPDHPSLPRRIMVSGPDTRLTVLITRWQALRR